MEDLDVLREALRLLVEQTWKELGEDDVLLGEKMGVSKSLAYQLHTGRKNVTVEHVAMLAKAQGVPVAVKLAHIVAFAVELTVNDADKGTLTVVAPGSKAGGVLRLDVARRLPPRKPSEDQPGDEPGKKPPR